MNYFRQCSMIFLFPVLVVLIMMGFLYISSIFDTIDIFLYTLSFFTLVGVSCFILSFIFKGKDDNCERF